MQSITIYFYRHGLTKGNSESLYIGHSDLPITTNSICELRKIKANYHYPQVDAVFVSPLRRCSESAEIMFPDKNPIVIDGFIEYDFGEFEGLSPTDLKDSADYQSWIRGDLRARPPHGESNAEFVHRICESFEKIVPAMFNSKTKSAAIVCHAGVIMTLLSCYGLPQAPTVDWQMDPGYGFKARITPSVWMQTAKFEVVDTSPQEHFTQNNNPSD